MNMLSAIAKAVEKWYYNNWRGLNGTRKLYLRSKFKDDID